MIKNNFRKTTELHAGFRNEHICVIKYKKNRLKLFKKHVSNRKGRNKSKILDIVVIDEA